MSTFVIFFTDSSSGTEVNRSIVVETVAKIVSDEDAKHRVAKRLNLRPEEIRIVSVGRNRPRAQQYAQFDPLARPRGRR